MIENSMLIKRRKINAMHGKIQNINNPIRLDQFVKIDPKSLKSKEVYYKRLIEILDHLNDYEVVETEITNTNGVPLQVFCKKKHSDFIKISDIKRRIQYCIEEAKNGVITAPLLWLRCVNKEDLEILKEIDVVYLIKEADFWWDDSSLNQMFFFGARDRVIGFLKAIHGERLYINNHKSNTRK